MKLKSIAAIISTLLVTSFSMVACGGGDEPAPSVEVTEETAKPAESEGEAKSTEDEPSGEPVELKIAVFEGGYGSDYWTEVSKLFESENEGVTVTITANPTIGDIIRPNIVAGNPPDFIYLATNQKDGVGQALIKDKALADISDVFTEELTAKMLPGFMDSALMQPYGDGKIYTAPIYYSPLGWWYNKDYFDTNELEAPVTWDDYYALQDKITDRPLFAYQGSHPGYLEGTIMPALAAELGVDGLNDCLTYQDGAWDSEGAIKVLTAIEKMGTEGTLMKGTESMLFSEAQLEFMMGGAAFIPNGTWFEGEMSEAPREENFEFGFSAAPVFSTEGEKYVKTTCEEMYIPAASKNIELAKKFLAFQYTDEAIALNAEFAKGVPPVIGSVEILKEHVSGATYEAQAIFEKGGYLPLVSGWAPVQDTEIMPKDDFFGKAAKVFAGDMTGEEWAMFASDLSKKVVDNLIK